ncbi:hypothetical protein D3C75_146830 [compost metagenome]|uniref:Uncharacterized protein n=2 Tax=Enterobacteriaceae TaxID=543 RepID=A0A9J6PV18_9ENTR|nr:hypothetical protein [Silvania hatchlandensis]MCU6663352.1 hypothetical protein [Silvania hatchlandensis]
MLMVSFNKSLTYFIILIILKTVEIKMTNYQHVEERRVDPLYPAINPLIHKRISWSAVFAGVVISIVVYLLLMILGSAIGATTVDPLQEERPLEGLATGAAIWIGVSMIISAAVGGYVSGWLAHRHGSLHGVLVFGVNTLICTAFLIMLANNATSGAISVVGSGMQTVGSSIKAVAPSVTQMAKEKLAENNINLDDFQNQLELTLRQTGKPELQPEALEQNASNEANMAQQNMNQGGDVTRFIKGLTDRNSATFEAADRQALKNIIMARTGKSDAEAEQMVDQAQKNYQVARQKYEELKKQAEQKAREAGEKAAAAAAKASWFSFFMLVVMAIVAGATGAAGYHRQHKVVVTTHQV